MLIDVIFFLFYFTRSSYGQARIPLLKSEKVFLFCTTYNYHVKGRGSVSTVQYASDEIEERRGETDGLMDFEIE